MTRTAHIDLKIFSLDTNTPIDLFDATGVKQELELTFVGKSDTDRGEEERYSAAVTPGKYWVVSQRADGSVNLSRVFARRASNPVVEFIALYGGRMKDADFAAFAGTGVRERIPETVSMAFLRRLERDMSQDYLRESTPPAPPAATEEDYRLRARRH